MVESLSISGALEAQWLACWSLTLEVAGSNPARANFVIDEFDEDLVFPAGDSSPDSYSGDSGGMRPWEELQEPEVTN